MRAGKLRRRLAYQVKMLTRNAYGQTVEAWSTVGTYWGEVRPLNGTEALIAGQIKGVITHVVTLRYPGFIPTVLGRLLYGTRIFQITSVSNVDERNRQVNLMVLEVVTPTEQS